ncbi:hypothetical protein IHV84_01895 [Acidovorax sp. IB03]|uniref:hypothetical protein n=1 Tax=Acidovorax sp. IB03 TaxID=2779366 RepID=UPI0018E86A18|nr:hypothetical protein [Acidovorax sp. IB03]MBJ2162724.1 hypothetical protein [Acidovorax sp. IB03]
MKLTKVAFAIASVLAVAAGTANAGNFQTNSTSVAREVIVGDAQAIVSPQVSYSFTGPVRNPAQATYFQIQLKLSDGEWVVPAGVGFPGNATLADGGNVALVALDGTTIASAWGVLLDPTDAKTLYATFQIPAGVGVNNARVVWNAAANGALATAAVSPAPANLLKIRKLKTLVGTIAECDQNIKQLTGSVKQFPNITDPTYRATDADVSPASEHVAPGNQNSGPILSFPVNLNLSSTAATTPAQDYNNGATLFDAAVGTVTASGKTANIGTVTYTKLANGYDTDLANVYGSVAATVPATAVSAAGVPELKDYSVTLTGNFASTAKFWLSSAACADAGYATGTAPVNGVVTVKNSTAANLAVGSVLNVCYGVDGLASIPSTGIDAKLVLNKAPDGAGDVAVRFEEQPNSCKGSFAVGSGIQIDVRNYASYATFGAEGAATSLRIINNSETATADLFAQMIYADGRYGAWGSIGTLSPRQTLNISNKELEAKLVNAPAASNPFGAQSVYTRADGNAVVANTQGKFGDRVRIVSTTGTTIRVQSYMVVGSSVIDTSNAQGVDFESLKAGRVPTGQNDAQPISQDAIRGLAK